MSKFNLQKHKLLDLFDLKTCTGPATGWVKENPGTNLFLSASVFNNGSPGRSASSEGHELYDGDCITVSSEGSDIGESFVQNEKFYATHHVSILRPKSKIPIKSLLFIAAVISNEKYRFRYGCRTFRGKRADLNLWLPTLKNGTLDHDAMAEAVKQAAEAKYQKIQIVAKSVEAL